jgi:hypothetical protein
MGVRNRPTSPRSPWQNPYVERLIGTLWRDCLDHVLILGEMAFTTGLTLYSLYYNETRTHLTRRDDAPSNDLGPSSPHKSGPDCIIAACGYDFRDGQGRGSGPQAASGMPRRLLPLVKVRLFLPSRLTSPGLIPGPTNSFPDTSATASASSPSFTGTLLRTNSMAPSLSDSYARKFRTIRGFPSESKVVTRMFHPAGILMRRNCRRSMTCLIQTDLVGHRGLIIPGLSPNESNAD